MGSRRPSPPPPTNPKAHRWEKERRGPVDAVHLPPLRTAPLARADQIASCAAERTQRARWKRRPPPPLPPPPCPPPPPPPPPRQAGGSSCGRAASLARPRCGLLFTAAAVKRRRSQRLCGAVCDFCVARGGARGGAAAATESSQVEKGEEHLEGKDSGVKVRHLGRLRRGSSTTPQACTP